MIICKMSLENLSLDVTITIVDNNIQKKAGQFRYIINGSEAEIFDTYMFPEYRRKKVISNIFQKTVAKLKASGVSKVKLQYLNDDARIAWEKIGFRHTGKDNYMEFFISES